jgi:hypothetical protein
VYRIAYSVYLFLEKVEKMKIVHESDAQVRAVSKHSSEKVKSNDERVQQEYLKFKNLYKDKFDSFDMHKDSYNEFGKGKVWVFNGSLKTNSFAVC